MDSLFCKFKESTHITSYAQRAVAILSDCRLNRDHTSKILIALSISPDSEALIRQYIQTAKPPLVEPLDLEMYTLALADLSVLEAWRHTRTFSESDEMRPRLFKKVLEWAVTRKAFLILCK
jgi:Nuclear pore complex assembly